MSKLNEDLLAQVARGADNEEEMEVGAVAPPDYVSAVEDRKKIRKELPGRFKDQEKATKAFVDDNHKREPKRKPLGELKKLKLSESLFEDVHISEATAVAEKPKSGVIYYKDAKHRDPLADVIQRELTDGEVVYKFSDKKGRFQATHAPSLNIDAMDVSVDYDEDRDDQPYILVRLADKALLDEVATVGKKYGKEVTTGTERFMRGDKKLFAKIYLDDADFDGHYFDPNVPVKTGKGKKDEDDE